MDELAANVCDALSDDALKVAMGIGADKLAQHDKTLGDRAVNISLEMSKVLFLKKRCFLLCYET